MAVSLADEAYLAIRDEILRGQLRPGRPLSRRRLALQLGMSVLPVSDALKRLEEDGLVETPRARRHAGEGADATDVRELRAARSARDAGGAAVRGTGDAVQRRELRRLAGQVDALFSRLAGRRAGRRVSLRRAQPAPAVPHADRRACQQPTAQADDRTQARADHELDFRHHGPAHAASAGLSYQARRGTGLRRSGEGGRAHARARALRIRRDFDAHRCPRRLGMARATARHRSPNRSLSREGSP